MAVKNDIAQWPLLIATGMDIDAYESTELHQLLDELKDYGFTFAYTDRVSRITQICTNKRNFSGVIVNWYMTEDTKKKVKAITSLRNKFKTLPIILIAERSLIEEIDKELIGQITMFYFLDQDTATFAAGRIHRKVKDYIEQQYPPFFKALRNYVHDYKYAWHTPGHMGGEGFLKSPAGIAFYNFYGENVMRSDLSVSVPELGSLLDHSGVVKDSEKLAEETFNSDLTYYILNGTSTANQTIWHSQVIKGDLALVDRNCHKSLNYGMVVTGAYPMYMTPRRNALGIIGPVPLSEFSEEVGKEKIKNNDLLPKEAKKKAHFTMSALTNSTYDGLCYNVSKIKPLLTGHVDAMHFDEAWYAYAAFHPIYDHFYGMEDSDNKGDYPPIFCSQSTHKLLTAFSQASMIHIKNGKKTKIDPGLFNEAFMMHSSTSPNYQMIASLDVASKMMYDDGPQMSEDNILAAIQLRKKIEVMYQKFAKKDDWFFRVWQPRKVPINGEWKNFLDATDKELAHTQKAWILNNEDTWHGFSHIEDDYVMLDPIKITIQTPGFKSDGTYKKEGIPAAIVTDYLIKQGVVVEKTDTYSFLLLHSFGTTEGKHGDLLAGLLAFKRDYDNNTLLTELFPDVVKNNPRFEGKGLYDLCHEMNEFYKKTDFLHTMQDAFDILPKQVMTPAEAYEKVVHRDVEYVYLDDMMGRIPAVMVVPYPPGIPVIMGGEKLDKEAQPIFKYLQLLQTYENTFKGYEKDIHGVERDVVDGKIKYKTYCIKK